MSGNDQPSGCAGMSFWAAVVAAVLSASVLLILAANFSGLNKHDPTGPGNDIGAVPDPGDDSGTVIVPPGGQPGVAATPTPGTVPPVSDRHFRSGSAHAVASGDLSFDVQLPIDKDKAYAQDGLAWIAFGSPGDSRAVLVSFDEPANSVAISRGGETALGVDDQCDFDVTVTDTQVSGHITCPDADALRDGKRVGSVSIDVTFSAGS